MIKPQLLIDPFSRSRCIVYLRLNIVYSVSNRQSGSISPLGLVTLLSLSPSAVVGTAAAFDK